MWSGTAHQRRRHTRPLDRRMVAIYSKEGTMWHNNPGGILHDVAWSSQEQQQAAAKFIDYLLQPAQQAKAADKGFRSANSSVAGRPYSPRVRH